MRRSRTASLREVEGYVQPILREAYEQQYRREIQLAQARLQRAILARLSALPEHKRVFADRAIKKILDKYYGEPESKVEPVVNVLLEAMERSDYRILLEHIAEATPGDVAGVAERLDEFGLAEMAFLVQQATARQVFLDQLDALARDAATTEAVVHKALSETCGYSVPNTRYSARTVHCGGKWKMSSERPTQVTRPTGAPTCSSTRTSADSTC